jgi:1-acyl-sn-glycerol-3-phosphate acyltransferase
VLIAGRVARSSIEVSGASVTLSHTYNAVTHIMSANQFALLSQRRFAPFFWVQFLGAANDNIFKFAFTLLVTYQAAEWGGMDPKIAGFAIGAIFIAPYVLFSATAGQLADKYDKRTLICLVKSLEIAIMLVCAVGFVTHNEWILFAVTFLMGLHSTLFGPAKYAYLPQHLTRDELTGGNGLVEMGTFVAILAGTIVGGELVGLGAQGPVYVAAVSVVVAIAGRWIASYVPASPPPEPGLVINWNPFTETWKNLKIAQKNRTVFLALLGISWLWFFGSVFLTSFSSFSKEILGGDASVVTLLLAIFSIGIAVGSLLCEVLSGRRIEIGLVPFGSIGMTIFAVDLYFASRGLTPTGLIGPKAFLAQPAHWRVIADLFLLALFGGLYSVPLYALIQSRCDPLYRARIIAACNILNALFMITAAIMGMLLFKLGGTIPLLFLVTGLLNAAVAIYIYTLVPEFLMRFITWILIHTVYRIRVKGLDNIPDEGPVLITANHVSFADAVVIGGVVRRPVRFVMDHRIFKTPLLGYLFRAARCIPIAPAKEDPVMLEKAYADIEQALRDGDIVGIFPEGRITDTGEIYPFKNGVTRILDRTPVPVVPMALSGFWGSFFSRAGVGAMKLPLRRGVWSKIKLTIDTPWAPESATPAALEARTKEMRGAWM